ncbi:MAG: argininosuccinate lyase [Deltaproteobacteria bacterium]|nr:argininosuccinate lyase [Deltaproteobacteria bacterium]
MDKGVEAFTASVHYDKRLAPYDIEGSMAHCRMLARQKIIPSADAKKILQGLRSIAREIEGGTFPFRPELEDIHMNIEGRLIEKIGDVGGRLHTARSRNDQVALDTRLFLRDAIGGIDDLIRGLILILIEKAKAGEGVIMPGFTHLQIAQPVLFAHHLLAYCEMFLRDRERLTECAKRVNRLPLGSGALAGTPFPIDREFVADQLGFEGVTENSMDAVSDRDYLVEFFTAASLIMMHLSRFSEELILWSSEPFSFVEMGDDYATGSSIMPQKKNPDVPELVRGKTGRVYGHLMAMLTNLKGLPLTYNRDLQEDKEPLFDTVDTVVGSLTVFAGMIKSLTIRRERMESCATKGFSTATDLADYLVRKGLPFRTAHEVTGKIVRFCMDAGRGLESLSLQEMQSFHPSIEKDIYGVLTPKASVASRDIPGGTAPARVKKRIAAIRRKVSPSPRRGRSG